jgi:oligogalacturonide lyase
MKTPRLLSIILLAVLGTFSAHASNVGRVYPSEKSVYLDPVTHREITVLTSDESGSSKPYQTHATWTSDGEWIIFRSKRGSDSYQVFLVNEKSGDIIQVTDAPGVDVGSLNLSRQVMNLYIMRAGVEGAPGQLVEIHLEPLIADALAGTPQNAGAYERIVAELPTDLRGSGGFAIDSDDSAAYWGVALEPKDTVTADPAPVTRSNIDTTNTNPNVAREAARERFERMGRGPGGIRRIDLQTGAISTVIDVPFRMGHVQTNPWVPGEILYCHETTGDAPQRMWTIQADGTGNRPLYVESPDEWITHETYASPDEVMFLIIGHLPYLRKHPTGIAVINLRTDDMKIIGQLDEDMGQGQLGGYWHCNGSPDGRWAVGDTFKGNIHVIDRQTSEQVLLTTDHKMKPDHCHPIFSPDSQRVLFQSGHLSDGKWLDLMTVAVPGNDS